MALSLKDDIFAKKSLQKAVYIPLVARSKEG